MKVFLLIYNPAAGDRYFRLRLDTLVAEMQQRGCLVVPVRTECKEDTPRLVALARQFPCDGILVAGGDGTVHEVVNHMILADVDLPLGVIPVGTSNDLAAYWHLSKDIAHCAAVFAGGSVRAVDVGVVNGRYFLNVASAGLLTGVAHSADKALKHTLGKAAYYLKGFEEVPRFRSIPVRIQADDRLIEGDVILFLVMNGGTVGTFTRIAPAARMDDGKLDLLIVHRCSLAELVRILISLMSGAHFAHKAVEYLQASHITISSDEHLESDVDGEQGPPLPLDITLLPKKIRLFVPTSRSFHFRKIAGALRE